MPTPKTQPPWRPGAELTLTAIAGAGLAPLTLTVPAASQTTIFAPDGIGLPALWRRLRGTSGPGQIRLDGAPPTRPTDLAFLARPVPGLLRPFARSHTADWLTPALAAAATTRPRVLILNAPFDTQPNPTPQIEALRALAATHRLTLLHLTARRAIAFAATHIALLDAGTLLQHATPARLYEAPQTLRAAELSGAVNQISGTYLGTDNDESEIRLDCGPTILADMPTQPLAPGAPCVVVLRPERLSVSPLAPTQLGAQAIAAILQDSAHLGDTIRLTVAIGTDTHLTILRPSAFATQPLTPGQTLSIAWQPRHALVFPAPTPNPKKARPSPFFL